MKPIKKNQAPKRKNPLYLYEVGIPVEEIWVMEVVARNAKEAKELVRTHGYQTCSVPGSRGWVTRLRKSADES